MNAAELAKLISDYVAGDISPQQHQALQDELKSDPRARAAFREVIDLEASLRTWATERVPPPVPAAARVGRAAEGRRGLGRKGWLYVTSVLATSAALVLVVAWLWWPRAGNNQQIAKQPPNVGEGPTSHLATIVQQGDCVWKSPANLAVGGRLSTGTLALTSGVAQLKFDSGTDVVMQAPCELTVVAADTARLLKGTVVVQVTELSDGFTLQTPDATIVDEGTEYAVSLDTEATEVHVFDGSVLWEPAAGGKAVDRIPAGEARRYLRSDPTNGARIPLRMVRFVRRIEADVREKAGTGLLAYDGFENLAGRIQRGRSGWGWSDGWKTGYHGHGRVGAIVDSPADTVFGQSRGGRRLLRLAGGETMRRDLEHPLPLDPGSVYYVSFLVERPQRDTESGRYLEVSLYSDDEHPRRRAQGEIGFGVTSDGFPYLKNGGKIVQSAPAIESGIVYLLVAKVAVSTDRAVETYLRVYRDGEPVGEHEPSAWSAVGRLARCEFTVSRIRLMTGDKAAFDVDEVRIGTTWQSVTSPTTATPSADVE